MRFDAFLVVSCRSWVGPVGSELVLLSLNRRNGQHNLRSPNSQTPVLVLVFLGDDVMLGKSECKSR